jgi:Mlc titration factor MtfA (ptsG expression regulator)
VTGGPWSSCATAPPRRSPRAAASRASTSWRPDPCGARSEDGALTVDPPGDRAFARAAAALSAATGLLSGAVLHGPIGATALGAVGLGAGLAFVRLRGRRARRRRALLATPFPESWRAILEERYDHVHRLPPALRRRFEDDVRLFVAEQHITGVEAEVTDELRLLVAASAVTLSLGWPAYEWEQLGEVLLYPDDFDRDYNFGGTDRSGETHPWGSIILSVPALHESFDDPDDGFHVGLHEFAHLLDVDRSHFDGIPPGLDAAHRAAWVALAEKEMERLRRGKSVLDPYGAQDPVEFLAVAVEAFFEAPLALRRRHRELYALLAAYFAQDPAAWDDARGLREA